jgi:hypothetical protein
VRRQAIHATLRFLGTCSGWGFCVCSWGGIIYNCILVGKVGGATIFSFFRFCFTSCLNAAMETQIVTSVTALQRVPAAACKGMETRLKRRQRVRFRWLSLGSGAGLDESEGFFAEVFCKEGGVMKVVL